jgi:hypothetical protein
MEPNGSRPTWKDFVSEINLLRAEMSQGFTRLEGRVHDLEKQVASQAGATTFARWILPVIISVGTLIVGLLGLHIAWSL